MDWYIWVIIIASIVIVVGVVPLFLVPFFICRHLYFKWFVKTYPEKFLRVCSLPSDKNQQAMWDEGMEYKKIVERYAQDVEITHDNLHLVGIYLDYGRKKTVIIIPGRAESSYYSYYFAPIYEHSSYNVLLIDPRSFGNSEGTYMSAGVLEADDILAWSKFLHEEKGQEGVLFHGICIGGATSILALSKENLPPYLLGAVVEGPFTSFRRMFELRTIQAGHKPFPTCNFLPHFFKKYPKVDIEKHSPKNSIKNVHLPLLYLQAKGDVFALWEEGKAAFDSCPSEKKEFVLFEKGWHSHIRQAETALYDKTVYDFVEKI
ncbi:MAG: alpha/beta hydrolase [Bacilli bacterium]|nr:alpha/beta hydrolase [Bacilli bacterium]